jgi:hypothetical protein
LKKIGYGFSFKSKTYSGCLEQNPLLDIKVLCGAAITAVESKTHLIIKYFSIKYPL